MQRNLVVVTGTQFHRIFLALMLVTEICFTEENFPIVSGTQCVFYI